MTNKLKEVELLMDQGYSEESAIYMVYGGSGRDETNNEETLNFKKHKRYHDELLGMRIKDMRKIANKYKDFLDFEEYGLIPLLMYVAKNGTVDEFYTLLCYRKEVTVNEELFEISRLLKIYA